MTQRTLGQRARGLLTSLGFPLLAITMALALGALFIAALGFDWLAAYQSLARGSLGSVNAVAESLLKATPLIFTGLSFAVGIRCGLINLGAEGQVYMGGLCAAFAGIGLSGLPPLIHLPLTLLAGVMGGGMLGLLTGWLKNRFGASELITGIMFNYMATWLTSYFVTGPLKEVGGNDFPQTAMVAEAARLPGILPGTRLHAGFLVALLCIGFYYIFLWKTARGYELRMVGLNPTAAEYAGIKTGRCALLAMFLAGGFAGLAGCSELLGVQLRLFQGFSPNFGFDGISVALLGNNSPVGIFFSAFLFGVLKSGSNKMKIVAQVPSSVVDVIQSLVLFFVVGRGLFQWIRKKRRALGRTVMKGGVQR